MSNLNQTSRPGYSVNDHRRPFPGQRFPYPSLGSLLAPKMIPGFSPVDLAPVKREKDPLNEAWVKIPGLDPREPNALRLMTLADITKLKDRLIDAAFKIEQARKVEAERVAKEVEAARAKEAAERRRQFQQALGIVIGKANPVFYTFKVGDRVRHRPTGSTGTILTGCTGVSNPSHCVQVLYDNSLSNEPVLRGRQIEAFVSNLEKF